MAIKFFQRIFGKGAQEVDVETMLETRSSELAIRELAYQICVLRIAKALSRCEFRTYFKGKEDKSKAYYLLNVRPNPQQSASEFWQDVVQTLYRRKEVLIVPLGEDFYVADSYSLEDKKVRTAWRFKAVTIGELTLNRQYTTETAVYLRLKDGEVTRLLDRMARLYEELSKYATTAYKNSNGTKLKLKIGRIAESREGFEDELQTMLQEDIKKFLENPNAAFPEFDGYDLQKLESSGAYRGTTSRDISALLNDVMSLTSKAFLMPENIALGDVADTSNAINDFLTFCLGPLVTQIEQAFNRILYTEKEYLQGSHLNISMASVMHRDLLSASASIDKLIGCGVSTINDILALFDFEPLPFPWANQRFMTKNYSYIELLGEENSSPTPTKGKEDP